jgi:hypothetical protein
MSVTPQGIHLPENLGIPNEPRFSRSSPRPQRLSGESSSVFSPPGVYPFASQQFPDPKPSEPPQRILTSKF